MKLYHLAIPYLALLAFLFGGILNSGGIAWYGTLTLPAWSPAPGVIALIWAVIYVCAAWSLLILWQSPRNQRFWTINAGFAAIVLINLVWSVMFFHLHMLVLSAWCAIVLGAIALITAALTYPSSKRAAFLLAPYILWVFFAAYLTYTVALLNA